MALNKIISEGIKDGEVKNADIATGSVDINDINTSSGTAGNTTYLRGDGQWATPPDTNTVVGGATGVGFDDDVKVEFGTHDDAEISHNDSSWQFDNDKGNIQFTTATTNGYIFGNDTDGVLVEFLTAGNNFTKQIRAKGPDADTGGSVRLYESNSLLDNHVTIEAHGTMSANYTFKLPADGGSADQYLKTDGSGNTSWGTVSTSADFSSLTDTTVNTSNPATNTNPSATGHIHLNKSTGQAFVCTDNSNNANVWKNIGAGASSIGASFSADFLVIAGGGGGSARGGGAGAGGMRASYNNETSGGGGSSESALTLNPGTIYTITVGTGGPAQSNYNITGSDGNDSSISGSDITDIVSVGGGGGGCNASQGDPGDGGSGGGGGYTGFATTGGTGTANQGYDGGDASSTGPYRSGGGGGAGGAGGDGVGSSTQCGHGGAGLASTITGSSVMYAGGGGGSGYPASSMVAGNAGSGGGGAGNNSGNGADGTDGKGGGAGGSYDDTGGKGGDGVVILRMPTANCNTPGIIAASSITTSGSDTIIKWLGSGEYQA